MCGYCVELEQGAEFAAAVDGYTFAAHQQDAGKSHFDDVPTVMLGGKSPITALTGPAAANQFQI